MGSSASQAAEDVKQMPSRTKQDIRFGLSLDKFGSTAEEADYRARTKASADRAANYGSDSDDNPRSRQPAPARAAPAPNYGIGAVAAAPSVPDPDAIGETERALLDAQKKGRSSTIQTSAKGLLSGEDDTRKRRSLMGGLIS
tara:strand:- start:356 stop:781 length:426 start_codon:yes stop_codon:yes gene_type:complete